MKIALVRSGGVAGMPRRTVMETQPGTLRDGEMRQLLARADLPRFSEATLRTGPDRLRYTVIVEDGEHRHSVTFDEEHMPEQIRPFVDAVMKHSSAAEDPEATKA